VKEFGMVRIFLAKQKS